MPSGCCTTDRHDCLPEIHDLENEIDFAYRWAAGEALETIPLPNGVDIGDAIKAMKGLYSLLRQLEWALRQAESPLLPSITRAVGAMEREVIKRT